MSGDAMHSVRLTTSRRRRDFHHTGERGVDVARGSSRVATTQSERPLVDPTKPQSPRALDHLRLHRPAGRRFAALRPSRRCGEGTRHTSCRPAWAGSATSS
jgi:hypothetical protein